MRPILSAMAFIGAVCLALPDPSLARGGGGVRGGGRSSISRPSGGGFAGGGGRSGGISGGGSARGSANVGGGQRASGGAANRSGNVRNSGDINRGNINNSGNTFNRNTNVNVDNAGGWGRWDDHPVGAGLAAGAVVGAATAAAIGSTYYALPPACAPYPYGGYSYYSCGGVYYEPRYEGDTVVYVTVPTPGSG